MNRGLIIGGVILLLILLMGGCGVSRYNSLVKMDESITGAWANVEAAYQRRADLIPNLVNTVKGYADFEQETLTQVIEARSKATSVTVDPTNITPEQLAQFQQAQDGLSSALSRLLVTVERYPDLKANQNFRDLQAELTNTENKIAFERKKFNDTVQGFNGSIRTFPNNILAGLAGLDKRGYFESVEGAEKAPEVSF
jgi:LemA protein